MHQESANVKVVNNESPDELVARIDPIKLAQEFWLRIASMQLILEDLGESLILRAKHGDQLEMREDELSDDSFNLLFSTLTYRVSELAQAVDRLPYSDSSNDDVVGLLIIAKASCKPFFDLLNFAKKALDKSIVTNDNLKNIFRTDSTSSLKNFAEEAIHVLGFLFEQTPHGVEHPFYKLSSSKLNLKMRLFLNQLEKIDDSQLLKMHRNAGHIEIDRFSSMTKLNRAGELWCIDYLTKRRECLGKVELKSLIKAWNKYITSFNEIEDLLSEDLHLAVSKEYPDCSMLFMKIRFAELTRKNSPQALKLEFIKSLSRRTT